MDDGTEEYMLKWNSHNTEVISEFHELCRVSTKSFLNIVFITALVRILKGGRGGKIFFQSVQKMF